MFMTTKQEVIRLVKDGYTAKEIKEILELNHESRVYAYAKQEGLKVTKANKRKLDAIRKMVDEGKHYDEIAEAFGMSRKAMTGYCHANKIYATPKPILKGVYEDDVPINMLAKCGDEWEYVNGYTGSDGFMNIRHKECGTVVRKSCVTIRKGRSLICEHCEQEARKKKEKQLQIEKEVKEFSRPIKKHKQIVMKQCTVCGAFFIASRDDIKTCSKECSKKVSNRYCSDAKERKRKMARTDESNQITVQSLYRRDKGRCWICGGLCDINADGNDNYYPSIDHIIPVSAGGKDRWDNVRLAHRICNSRRGTTPAAQTISPHQIFLRD